LPQNDESIPIKVRKIRVMHVTTSRAMGGSERMFTHLIPHFDKTRFVSCLMCFGSPSPTSEEWKASGIEVHHLNMDKPISVIGVIRCMKLLRQWKPDILMVYGLRANLMARPAAWLCRVPVFVTGQRGIEDWKGRFAVFLERTTSVFVDLYIGNSQACCDMLARREKIASRKLYVIPNGIHLKVPDNIDKRTKEIRTQYKIPPDSIVIGTVGRLDPIKGHQFFIAAAQIVLRKHPEAFFVLVGKDSHNSKLQTMAQQMQIHSRVCFAGYSKEVAVWLNCFDIFVLPSLSEGMPVSVIEAIFMSKPVIATSVGGTPEVIQDGQTGLLIPPADPERVAEAIITMIENPELRHKFAQAGHKRALSHFTVDRMTKRYEDIFIELLSRKEKHT
jgi:glycosyltransferase involved in cell wall biosynthesis